MDVRRSLTLGMAALVLVTGIGAATTSTTRLVVVDTLLVALILAIFQPGAVGLLAIAVLGAAPFAAIDIAGYNVPVVLILSAAAALMAVTRPRRRDGAEGSQRWTLLAGCLVIGTGTVSFAATNGRDGTADALEFAKWLSASLLFVPALCCGARWVDQARRTFAVSVGLGAIFALAATYTSQAQTLMSSLGVIGYLRNGADARYFLLGGVSQAQRVTGSYTDPNTAAIFFLCGLAASASLRNRVLRGVTRGALLVALGGTLGRGALIGSAVAVVAFVLVGRGTRQRVLGMTALAIAASIVLAVPATRERLITTGSGGDVGVSDRATQLREFPSVLAGNWTFGLGYGRPEFRDSAIAYQVDEVANAPLAAVYRGGIMEGVGFAAWYGLALALALRLLRTRRRTHRDHGIVLLAFAVAALTGYGTVLIPELVGLFALQISLASAMVASERVIPDAGTAVDPEPPRTSHEPPVRELSGQARAARSFPA
jgi:polysaccharide biosynthesis protein PslJ